MEQSIESETSKTEHCRQSTQVQLQNMGTSSYMAPPHVTVHLVPSAANVMPIH